MTTRAPRMADGSAPELEAPASAYWDDVAASWAGTTRAWRRVSDAVNRALLARWLPRDPGGAVLKTDLFDELAGEGLVGELQASFGSVTGIDIAPGIVRRVSTRFPRARVRAADVRRLPFDAASFSAVFSNSTLDHFDTPEEIADATRELYRVLRPGGHLVVTLDNPDNPVVRLRNALPVGVQQATLVPYRVGATLGRRDLRALLAHTGFEVIASDAVFHSPRLLVVGAGRLVDRLGDRAQRIFAHAWLPFEILRYLPTRFLTGYYVAALARKPA